MVMNDKYLHSFSEKYQLFSTNRDSIYEYSNSKLLKNSSNVRLSATSLMAWIWISVNLFWILLQISIALFLVSCVLDGWFKM